MPDAPPPIPDFTLLRSIGRGAYGEVWLARSVTGVYRAVKIVRRDSFGDDRPFDREFAGLQRFEPVSVGQESQVGLLHVGRNDAEGFFYYVMELADDVVTGEEIYPERYVPKTLKELRARQSRLPAGECLDIGLALTRALAHLHENGLVHRDIKPSNVIFVHGVPKLADIGLVSAIDTSHSFVGTEGFVPPEGPGTAAADIFSLGKVLYEISAGRDRKDFPNLPEDLDSMPDRRALLELNEVVLQACDTDAERRYATAAEMREDLLLVQAGRSVRRLHLIERRLRFIAKYGIAATVISILAITAFFWASKQTRLANANLERAERAEAEVQERLREANTSWARANRLTGRVGQRHDSLAELAKAAARTNRLDLRNEAIACLMLPDVRPIKTWAKTPLWDSFNFSADFRLYGTNDHLGNLFIRDTATDELRHMLPSQGFPVAAAASSRDGRFVATSDMFGQAWLWTLGLEKPRVVPFALDSRLLDFTSDGRFLVVKTADGALRFINTTNLIEEQKLEGFPKLRGLQFNSTGDRFAYADQEKLHIHRRRDGSRVNTISAAAAIQAVAWHPNGRHIAASWARYAGFWSTESGQQRALYAGHESLVVGLAFNTTGDLLASSSWDRTTRFWHPETGRELLSHNGSGGGLRISPDGRRFVFKAWDGIGIELHELADSGVTRRFSLPRSAYVAGATFSRDGNLLAIATDAAVHVCSPTNPVTLATLPVGRTGSAEFTPDGRTLYTGGENGLQKWPVDFDPATGVLRVGKPELVEAIGKRHVVSVRASAQWNRLVVHFPSGPFITFPPEKPGNAAQQNTEVGSQYLVHINGDGTLALGWPNEKSDRLHIWNPRTGALVTNLVQPSILRDAAISPDNRWLAISTYDTTSLWSVGDWREHHTIKHPLADSRHKVAFSPDGRLLASAVSDHELWLIDVESGSPLAAIPTDRMLTGLVFNPSGDTLVATYEFGYYQTWNIPLLRQQLAALNLNWPEPSGQTNAPAK